MTQSQAEPTLVMGAAGGQQGGTGARVTRELLAAGAVVRAFVRSNDERARTLASLGAQLHVGDVLDFDSVRASLTGMKRVYFLYPVRAGLLKATAIMAACARDAAVEVIVNLSQGSASPTALSPTSQEHWLAERVLDWSGVPVIHLRGAVFFENILRQTIDTVREHSEMRLPFGSGAGIIPSVAGADVAHVAAAVLQRPHAFIGTTINITGPQVLTARDFAQGYADCLAQPVHYVEISDEQQRARIEQLLGTENREQIEHLSKLWTLLRLANVHDASAMGRVSPAVEKITGRPGTRWESFLQDQLAQR